MVLLLCADKLLLGIWSQYETPVVAITNYSYSYYAVLRTTEVCSYKRSESIANSMGLGLRANRASFLGALGMD